MSIDAPADDTIVRPGARLLDRKELTAKVNLTYPTIWKLMREGAFPRSIVIGGKVLWREHEIDEYIARLPRRRLKGESEGVPFHGNAKRKAKREAAEAEVPA
jgi:predicted DNA-binding transcriptional regulator AlpA